MSALIIDQLLNLIKKIRKIVGWKRDEEQDKDEKHIPRIPILLYTKPGSTNTITETTPAPGENIQQNINQGQGAVFWTKATAATEKQEKLGSKIIRKFAKRFKKGGSKTRGRNA